MYCTVEDVKGVLYRPVLAQMTAQFKTDLDANITKHITNACGYIDSMLCGAFAVPFTTPPDAIITAATFMAVYFCTAQFSEKEAIAQDKYDTANAMLQSMREAGKIPGAEGAETTAASSSRAPRGGSDAQVFTATVLEKW